MDKNCQKMLEISPWVSHLCSFAEFCDLHFLQGL